MEDITIKITESKEPDSIKITVPKGYEIDEENSTFNHIKLKPIPLKNWANNYENTIFGYFINNNSEIFHTRGHNYPNNYNIFATEKQAKSALAMARISQIMANDKRFGGPVTAEEWNTMTCKYSIKRYESHIHKGSDCNHYVFLAFHTSEQRDLFLEENEQLVKDYLMID